MTSDNFGISIIGLVIVIALFMSLIFIEDYYQSDLEECLENCGSSDIHLSLEQEYICLNHCIDVFGELKTNKPDTNEIMRGTLYDCSDDFINALKTVIENESNECRLVENNSIG